VLSCNGIVKLSQSEIEAFCGYQFRPDSIIYHFTFIVGMFVIVRIFISLFQFSLSPINGTVIMPWVFSEWSCLFNMNNFCSYTFLLSVLVSVILSSLLCCSTVMNITAVFSKTWVVWLLNNSVIVMIVSIFPVQWLCTTHKYAWYGCLLSDKFILLTTVGFLYVLATVLVLFSPETDVLCVIFKIVWVFPGLLFPVAQKMHHLKVSCILAQTFVFLPHITCAVCEYSSQDGLLPFSNNGKE